VVACTVVPYVTRADVLVRWLLSAAMLEVKQNLTSTMGPNSLEQLRQAIDADIESLKESDRESDRALRQRRNALAPISFLPAEIVEDIFLHASAKRNDYGIAWLHVAHVCRQWREIALNQPLFWSHINFTNLTLAGVIEMLARAKNAPLHLEVDVTDIHWDDARYNALENELQAHVSNIRHLSVIGKSTQFYTSLRKLVTSPAPTLEYLSLSHLDPTVQVYLPDTLFDGTTPRLSCLELREISISWKSPLLKGLRYLKICGPTLKNRPSLAEWLDVLDKMPQLKELVLHSASPNGQWHRFPFDIEHTVTLPFLTHLDISANAKDCAISLAHLVLPALTSLCLTANSVSFSGGDVLNLLPYVTQHAHGTQDTQPLQSVLFHSDEARTHIIAWPRPGISVEAYDLAAAKLTARVALSIDCLSPRFWYTSTYLEVLDAAIEALPLDNLVTLAARRRARLDKQIWLRHAPRWPLLEDVRLAPRAASGLIQMLLVQDNGRESPLLPSLIRLNLLDTMLSERRTRRLCEALKKRVEQGVLLKVLDLQTCSFTTTTVQLLRELVVDVRDPGTCGEFVFDNNSEEEFEGRDE
jgi:hypothetical protein